MTYRKFRMRWRSRGCLDLTKKATCERPGKVGIQNLRSLRPRQWLRHGKIARECQLTAKKVSHFALACWREATAGFCCPSKALDENYGLLWLPFPRLPCVRASDRPKTGLRLRALPWCRWDCEICRSA